MTKATGVFLQFAVLNLGLAVNSLRMGDSKTCTVWLIAAAVLLFLSGIMNNVSRG